ncbi:MAG: hypothetical protein WB766_25375 [Roseiarcus sp.]
MTDTILNGQTSPGKDPGTTAHYSPTNNLTVITDDATGNVVTVRKGRPKRRFLMTSDERLLTEMEAAVRSFDTGRITFRALLDRLESCVDNLSDEDLPWKEAFQQEWGILEDTYAYASFKGQKTILESDMPAVEVALGELKRLIAEKTGRPA